MRLKPDFAEAHVSLANALAGDSGRLQEAIAHYEEALRLQPDYAEVALQPGKRAGVGSRQACPRRSRITRRRCSLNPDYAEAHTNLAIVLAGIPAACRRSISHFEWPCASSRITCEAHNDLAMRWREPGAPAGGDCAFEQALKIKPDYADAHCNMAVALAKMGRVDEAIAHLETALRINPGLTAARNNLARLRTMAGR